MNRSRWPLGRLIHRRGAWFDGVVSPPDPADGPPAAGASTRERRAQVRLSTTFGWPPPLPDWVGLAVRILDGAGSDQPSDQGGHQGGHLDLLLVSSAPETELWRQMRPNREVLACCFTSAMLYRLGGADHVVAAVPASPRPGTLDALLDGEVPCPITYRLRAAEKHREWRPLGDLTLTAPLPEDPGVRFHPPRAGTGWAYPVRRTIYTALQGRWQRVR